MLFVQKSSGCISSTDLSLNSSFNCLILWCQVISSDLTHNTICLFFLLPSALPSLWGLIVLLYHCRSFSFLGGGGVLSIQYHTSPHLYLSVLISCFHLENVRGSLYSLLPVFIVSSPPLDIVLPSTSLSPFVIPGSFKRSVFTLLTFSSPPSFSSLWHNCFCPRRNWAIVAWRWWLFIQPFRHHSVNLSRWQIII